MIEWPATLPPLSELEQFTEESPDLVLRTPMETGPAKMRRRFTAGVRPLAGRLLVSLDQVEILDAFYLNDCAGGSLPFAAPRPRGGAVAAMNFVKPPKFARESGIWWRATLELEVLP